jgi:hypothetical protein
MTDLDDAIPQTFDQWRHCIEHHCGIPLTAEFAQKRIKELENPKSDHTKRFIESYGPQHHERVLSWFRQVT